jgi:hypothetical protein
MGISQGDEKPGKHDGYQIIRLGDVKKNAASIEEHRQLELVGKAVLDEKAFGRFVAVLAIAGFLHPALANRLAAAQAKQPVKDIDQQDVGKQRPEHLKAGHHHSSYFGDGGSSSGKTGQIPEP